jgi:hypothetical protein
MAHIGEKSQGANKEVSSGSSISPTLYLLITPSFSSKVTIKFLQHEPHFKHSKRCVIYVYAVIYAYVNSANVFERVELGFAVF